MILDSICSATTYRALHPLMADALDALGSPNLLQLPDGRHRIQGDDMVAIVQHYTTKPRDQGTWEAHRVYTDIQWIVTGAEMMGCAPISWLTETIPYHADQDIVFLHGAGPYHFFTVPAGSFAVFFPHDAHMPGLAPSAPSAVYKIVLKVRVPESDLRKAMTGRRDTHGQSNP